jgi:hypothetical protein
MTMELSLFPSRILALKPDTPSPGYLYIKYIYSRRTDQFPNQGALKIVLGDKAYSSSMVSR